MRIFLLATSLFVICSGCAQRQWVQFDYSNLSTNDIGVKVRGLPPLASPGILVPTTDESDGKTAVLSVTGKFSDRTTIIWQENGTTHQRDFTRGELGVPAGRMRGKLHFTYL